MLHTNKRFGRPTKKVLQTWLFMLAENSCSETYTPAKCP